MIPGTGPDLKSTDLNGLRTRPILQKKNEELPQEEIMKYKQQDTSSDRDIMKSRAHKT